MKKLGSALLLMLFLLVFVGCGGEPERGTLDVRNCTCAKFAYKEDNGYKLVTSEIQNLMTIDSLTIAPTDKTVSGDWIYRIVFDPAEVVPQGKECVVLFCADGMVIDDKNYTAADGVDYADILAWAENKYAYFEYELIAE